MEALTQRLEFEDFPGRSLTVMLFKDVTNSAELRGLVVSGALTPECGLANAALVPDLLVLHVAARLALAGAARGAQRTRSLHAELVFGLGGSKHIAQTLERFGINPECRHVLLARFDATPAEEQQMRALVAGTPAPLSELAALTDAAALGKHLKATPQELEVGSLVDSMLMRIAARDC